MFKIRKLLIFALIIPLFSGCMVGPDYQRPPTAFQAKWATTLINQQATRQETLQNWWQSFHDPILTSLITQACLGNLDVFQAEARLREARANRDLSVANILPEARRGIYPVATFQAWGHIWHYAGI